MSDKKDHLSEEYNKKAAEGAKVVIASYNDAGPELRRAMEMTMESIQKNPDSAEAVASYGEQLFAGGVKSPSEFAVCLGASLEVLRRYNEQYIPNAQKQFEQTQAAEDKRYLLAILKRKEDFIDRVIALDGAFKNSSDRSPPPSSSNAKSAPPPGRVP